MKLLDKTIFRGKVLEIESLEKRLEGKGKALAEITAESNEKSEIINNLKLQLDELNKISKESLEKALINNLELQNKLESKEKLRRKNAGAIGGLKAENNKLIAENTELAFKLTELKNEFEEFKKNKFVVKELKAEKVPKSTQVMRMKSGDKTSKIIKQIKEEVEV